VSEPLFVLLPAQISTEHLLRICHFEGWGATPEYVRCTDTGLVKGRKSIYALGKHRGQEYRFPASRAIFVFAGIGF
jgi:hypothetical protein